MIDAAKHASINLAALDLIECSSAAYYTHTGHSSASHEFRAHAAFRRIASALGYHIEPIAERREAAE